MGFVARSDFDQRDITRCVGVRIRNMRTQAKATLQMLSEAVGVSIAVISAWETGRTRVSLEAVESIAAALDIAPMLLLPEEWCEQHRLPIEFDVSCKQT